MSPWEGAEMLYTEDFKKQVVKKALSPGVVLTELGKKLGISDSSIQRWRLLYGAEMQGQVQQLDVEALVYEPPVDVEELLRQADQRELAQLSGSETLAQQVDQLRQKGKASSQYTDDEKYAVVKLLRSLPADQQGAWLRQLGVQGGHLRLWEENLIDMSKKTIANDEYTHKLEVENRLLKKQLKDSERDVRELKILIELKKKYPSLFQQDEDKS